MASDSQPPSPDATAAVGQLLDGRYQLLAFIGEGGMGKVFRARDTTTEREVALKLLHRSIAEQASFADRFEREALVASKLTHENCVEVLEYGHFRDGTFFIAMELLEGRNLGDLLDEHHRLPVPRALHIAKLALAGLGHAHAIGIIHRDVKPDNIFLVDHHGDRDFVKLVDFGIAKLAGEASSELEHAQLTQVGTTVGTPKYMSPEQAFGSEVDARADLYSLTVVLYMMLAGRAPFEHDEVLELLMAHASAKVPPLSQHRPDLADFEELESLLAKGLAKKRDDRFADSTAYIDAIDAVMDEHHARQHRPQVPPRSSPLPAAAELINTPVPTSNGQRPLARRLHLVLGGIVVLALVVIAIAVDSEAPASEQGPIAAAVEQAREHAAESEAENASETALAARALNEKGDYRRVLAFPEKDDDSWLRIERGHAAFSLGRFGIAMSAYARALRELKIMRRDRAIEKRAREALDLKDLEAALAAAEILVLYHRDEGAAQRITELAVHRKPEIRIRARKLAKRADIADDIDRMTSYTLDLEQGRTCDDRRAALLELEKLGDTRALPAIKKARRRMRGGLLGVGAKNSNRCLKEDAERIATELEERVD